MRGKLAKQLRKVTGFHPYPDRQYRMANGVTKFMRDILGRQITVDVGHFMATGPRRDYQDLKADVLRVKRSGGGGGCAYA